MSDPNLVDDEVFQKAQKEFTERVQKIINLKILEWVDDNKKMIGGGHRLGKFYTALENESFDDVREILGDMGLAVDAQSYQDIQILSLVYNGNPVKVLWPAPDQELESIEEAQRRIDDIIASPGERHEECPECGSRQIGVMYDNAEDTDSSDFCMNPGCDWIEECKFDAGE